MFEQKIYFSVIALLYIANTANAFEKCFS
ncbi:uncharacterized protein METZ01_LOCUS124607, partial [marine metagenome]